MPTLWQRTEWTDFKRWAEKYGWIQIYFMLKEDKSAEAGFILPSGKYASVHIQDDDNRRMVIMRVSIDG